MKSEQKQLAAINSEIDGISKLLDKGLVRKPRYLALTRRAAEIEGRRYI